MGRFYFVQVYISHFFSVLTPAPSPVGCLVLVVPWLVCRVLILCGFLIWATYTAAGRLIFLGSCVCPTPLPAFAQELSVSVLYLDHISQGCLEGKASSFTSGKRRFLGRNESQQEIRTQGSPTLCSSQGPHEFSYLRRAFFSVPICWVLSLLTGCLKTIILHMAHVDWVSGF